MAKVTEIRVGARFVKNLGNYQSFAPEASVTIVLEEGDDVNEVYANAWDMVGDQIAEQLKLFEEDSKSGITRGLK